MKTHNPPLLLILLLILTIGLSACNQDATEEITPVGLVVPLSGSLDIFGQSMRDASEMALAEVNNKQAEKLRFVVADSGSTPEGAVTAFNKLIQGMEVPAIIGPNTSGAAQAAFPVAQQHGIVGFSPTAAASGLSAIGDFVFQANLTVDVVIPSGVEITAKKFGYKTAAVLLDNADIFSQSAYTELVAAFGTQGITLLTTETLLTNDTDFTAQLTRIKNLNPDAIFISTLPNEAARILTQAQAIGIPSTVRMIVPFSFSTAEVNSAGTAAEGVVTFSTWVDSANTPGNQAFVKNYRANYGIEPSRFAAQQYASVQILGEAIRNASAINANSIREAMANIKDFDTILGKFSFDPNGQAVYDPIILIVRNGVLEVLD